MAYKPLFGSREREQVWQLECLAAHNAERGKFPICIHCDLPVVPPQAWDRAHVTVPRAFGGKSVGVGHQKCNQLDNNLLVTPAAAKADAVRKKYAGVSGPGLGLHAMPGGRRSRITKTMRGGVQPRLTLAQRHREFLRNRFFVDVEDFSEPLEVQ